MSNGDTRIPTPEDIEDLSDEELLMLLELARLETMRRGLQPLGAIIIEVKGED
jgi:hypothetical protein